MPHPELIAYVKKQLSNGLSAKNIEAILIKNGWKREEVDHVLAQLTSPPASPREGEGYARPSHRYLFAILGVLAVIAVGAAAFIIQKYKASPQSITTQVVNRLADLQTLKYDGQFALALKEVSQGSSTPFKSFKDLNLILNFWMDSNVRERSSSGGGEIVMVSKDESQRASATFQSRSANGVFYFMFPNLPDLPPLPTKEAQGKWHKLDLSLFSLPRAGSTSTASASFHLSRITDVLEVFRSHRVVSAFSSLPDEEVGGVPSYHATFSLNPGALRAAVGELEGVLGDSMPQLKAYVPHMRDVNGEVWVGKKDLLPKKIKLSYDYRDEARGFTAAILIAFNFKSFNEPFSVEVPAGAESGVEFFEKIFTVKK